MPYLTQEDLLTDEFCLKYPEEAKEWIEIEEMIDKHIEQYWNGHIGATHAVLEDFNLEDTHIGQSIIALVTGEYKELEEWIPEELQRTEQEIKDTLKLYGELLQYSEKSRQFYHYRIDYVSHGDDCYQNPEEC